jgi:hypothetical protein
MNGFEKKIWQCPACLKIHTSFANAERCYRHHTREERDSPKTLRAQPTGCYASKK